MVTVKLSSNWMQELNQKSILKYLGCVMHWIENETGAAMCGVQLKQVENNV
jgi:hypothetical protein